MRAPQPQLLHAAPHVLRTSSLCCLAPGSSTPATRCILPAAGRHASNSSSRRWAWATTAARAAGDTPQQQPREPVLRQEPPHTAACHGTTRPDEYRWVTQRGPADPEVLAHLRAESQHTISRLAHTRSLQLQLQATLAAWQLAAAQAPQQQQQQAGSSSGGSCSTAADWLGGRGRLCYAQSSSFGWPGTVCGGRAFFSLPVGGTDALQHFSAPATAVEAAAAAGADAPLPPPGSVLLWSELPAASSTAASRPRNQVHSLALSHDGGLLAVTYSCCDSAAGGSANSHALAVLDAASGDTLVQHADGVDGPVLWAAPAWAAGTAPQERAHQQQLKHLLYVSHGHRQVHCLVLPSPAAAAVGVLPQQQPQMRLVFKDPQHVSLSIAAHDGTAFIIVAAADGAPRQVLCHCSSSGGGAPDDARAWRPLLAAADAAAAAGVPAVAAGDDDASMRLAVTLAAGVALVRLSSALQPQGLLLAADMRQQQGQQQQPPQHVWHHVPLPSVEPGMRLEALFAGSTAHAGGAAGAGQQELQLLVLTVQQRQQQGERLEWGAPATRQALHAHSYTLALPGPAAAQVQQQAEACLAGCCEVPLPDPFWRLHSASWCCATGQLRISFSSLVRPHSELRVNMQQLCDQQQRQPVAAAAATADSSAQASAAAAVQLAQLLGAPRGFQQEHYAAVQLLVTAPDGARVPVSLAFRRDGLGAAERMRAPLAAGPGPGPDSSSSCGRVLLCCYGSYGIAENAGFQSELLPLLDAGWCVAVAHVRGGGALGRRWAEAGRGAGKAASVGDLLAVARHLVQAGVAAPGGVCLRAASAGGWLAASALLQAGPGRLFGASALTVPCLDPLGLLLDEQQGLLELGDAIGDAQAFHALRSWAPYDLLEQQLLGQAVAPRLPHMLLRAALHDAEVPVGNPLKALARLRRLRDQQQVEGQGQQQSLMLLRVVPGGHDAFGGDVKEAALQLAFLLDVTAARG